MPLLRVQTNVRDPGQVLTKATELVVQQLHKPREYVQVLVETGLTMAFAGSTEPTAFVELRSLGLTPAQAKALSGAIGGLLQQELGVPPGRLFINFFDIDPSLWGWNGDTFA